MMDHGCKKCMKAWSEKTLKDKRTCPICGSDLFPMKECHTTTS